MQEGNQWYNSNHKRFKNPFSLMNNFDLIYLIGLHRGITKDVMNLLYNTFENQFFNGQFLSGLLKFGNLKFLTFLVEKVYQQQNYGFNELHFSVLSKSKVADLGQLRV